MGVALVTQRIVKEDQSNAVPATEGLAGSTNRSERFTINYKGEWTNA